MFRLRTLGGLSLERDGRPANGGSSQRRRLALLALLAAHHARGLAREKVVALLWPESDEESARNTLKQAVHVLRRELGAEAISGVNELRLNPDLVSCDLAEFEGLLDAGRLAAAVAAYGGPFLDGFHLGADAEEFERWSDAERGRLAGRFAGALESLAKEAESRGDQLEALGWWRRLAATDPLDSRLAAHVITSLSAVGDRAGALRHADGHRLLLRDDLGLEPGPEFTALLARLRDSPTIPVAPAPSAKAAQPPAADPTAAVRANEPERRSPVPSRRWPRRSVLAVGGALAAAGLLVGPSPSPPSATLSPGRVAVVAFQHASGDRQAGVLGELTGAAIARRLTAAGMVEPVVTRGSAGGDLREAAASARARFVVSGAVVDLGEKRGLQAALTDAVTGERLWSVGPIPVRQADSLLEAAESLGERTAAAVAARLDPELAHWIGTASQPTSLESYQEFRRGFDLYHELNPAAALPHFQAAGRDTAFTLPLLFAAWAAGFAGQPRLADSLTRVLDGRRLARLDRALVDEQVASLKGDLGAAYDAAKTVAAVAPGSEWLWLLANDAIKVGRAHEAVRIFEKLDPDLGWLRHWSAYWEDYGRALHFIHDYQRGIAVMEEGRRRFPTNRILLQMYIVALVGAGRVADVEAEVGRALTLRLPRIWSDDEPMGQAVLELRAHGYPEAARRLAEQTVEWYGRLSPEAQQAWAGAYPDFLVEAGRLGEARPIYAQRVRDHPDDWESVASLAAVAAEQGDRQTAEQLAQRLARAPQAPNTLPHGDIPYVRATVVASLGQRDEAVRLLREALRAGFEFRTVIHLQREFASLRGYPPFDELTRPTD